MMAPFAAVMRGLGGMKTKLRIIFSNVQILTNLSGVFSINFPPMFSKLLELGSIANLDLFTLLPVGCWSPGTNYHTSLVSRTLFPIIVVGGLTLGGFTIDSVADHGIKSGRLRRVDHLVAVSEKLYSHAAVLLFLAFPGSCVTVSQR